MNKKLIATLVGSVAIVATLAGCSASNGDAKPSSTASASSSAKADAKTDAKGDAKKDPKAEQAAKEAAANTAPKATGKCVDDKAIITAAEVKDGKAVLGDCATVWVTVNDAQITLGNVKKLAFEGTGNKVTHTGATPEVVAGDKNTVTAKK